MRTLYLYRDRMMFKGDVPPEICPFGRPPRSFPICGDVARRILMHNRGRVQISPALRVRFREIRERQEELLSLAGQDDAPGRDDLLPYQRVAVRWLLAARRGILADSQGLGKTVMSLVAADAAKPRRAVIVCNDSKIPDWAEHVRRWTTRSPLALTGNADERQEILGSWTDEFLICNFAQILLNDLHADLIIVDEAHNARNRKTQTFDVLKRMCAEADWVFLLTASPTVNVASDIWSLLHLVDPARFSSYWLFAWRFFDVHETRYGIKVGGVKDGEREALERILSVYVLRREKDRLNGLPKRARRVVSYQMPAGQAALYDEMLETGRVRFGDEEVWSDGALSEVTRLRQLALDPSLVFPDYKGGSKLDALVEVIREGDGKAVVFTMFEQLAKRAVERLNAEGIRAVLLTGSVSPRERERALAALEEDAQALVATHGVGGEGLNLVAARRAIFLDLAWHPAGNIHAEDRIYRIGQRAEEVETVVILTRDSIEEHIFDIISQKREVQVNELMRRLRSGKATASDAESEPAERDVVSAGMAPWV